MIALNPFPKADFLGNRPFPGNCLDKTNPGASWQKNFEFLKTMCFAKGSASAALSASPSARLSDRSRNALGCALGALSERIRIKLGTPSAAPSERPQ